MAPAAKVYPLLFDLEPRKPTTRDVAQRVKDHGAVAGLPDAAHPADGATYQEVICRSALNPCKGMPCQLDAESVPRMHARCHYCFARRYHVQFELDSSDQFSSVISRPRNFVQVLEREPTVRRGRASTSRWAPQPMSISRLKGTTRLRGGRFRRWRSRAHRPASSPKGR